MATKETKLVKFVKNIGIDGVPYGPDYDQDTVEVPANEAAVYIATGDAVEADAKPKK